MGTPGQKQPALARPRRLGIPRPPERVTIGGVEFNVRMAAVLWTTVVVTMVYYYHVEFLATWLRPLGLERFGMSVLGMAHNQFALFFVVPLLVIFLLGDSPRDYGLRLGRWKEGLVWLAVVCPLILFMLVIVVPQSNLQSMYRGMYYDVPRLRGARLQGADLTLGQHLSMLYSTGVLLWAWEYLLRGFCLFGLARVLGPGPAIFIQMVPFALLHLGKDELETMTTWLSGVGFGFVAWRTQSFLNAFLIHWFMLAATIWIAVGFS